MCSVMNFYSFHYLKNRYNNDMLADLTNIYYLRYNYVY